MRVFFSSSENEIKTIIFFSWYIKSKQIFFYYLFPNRINDPWIIHLISQWIGFGYLLDTTTKYITIQWKKKQKYFLQTLEIHSFSYPIYADKSNKNHFFVHREVIKLYHYCVRIVSLGKFGIDKNSGQLIK